MEYRTLGRSGLKVSTMTMGTMTFGGKDPFTKVGTTGLDDARRQIDLCIDSGINLIDTANVYSAGVSEEILFRGVIQPGLTRWMPAGTALLITSVLFGLVHFASRSYALFATIMGCYLGMLFQLTGNLFAPMVTHATYDFVALIWVSRRVAVSAHPGR